MHRIWDAKAGRWMHEPRPNIIDSEWKLGMATARILWSGTSIVEGAFYYIKWASRFKQIKPMRTKDNSP